MYTFVDFQPAVSGGAGNTFVSEMPAGRFSALQLTLTGTTDAGETLALTDIGNIEVSERGRAPIRMNWDIANNLADIKGGYPAKPSGSAATAERVVAIIPFGYSNLPNVAQLRSNNEMSVKLEFNSLMATRFGANAVNVRIDAVQAWDVFQSYRLHITSQDQQVSAAGERTDNISGRNTIALLLKDASDEVNNVNIKADGRSIVDNTPFAVLKDGTNLINRIESAGQPWAEVPIGESGVQASTLNESVTIQTDFAGAATMGLYKVQVEWLDAATRAANKSMVDQYLAQKRRQQGN